MESELIISLFGNNLVSIHHIGSTSVPDIFAKPVIDVLAVIKKIEDADKLNNNFMEKDYEPRGEYGIPGRRYFVKKESANSNKIHLHTFGESDTNKIEQYLAFRDYLINNPEAAAEYSKLKISLAEKFSDDSESYQKGKDNFIKDIERKAMGRTIPA